MKRITYLALLVLSLLAFQIQSQVQVGNGMLQSENAPIEPFFGFSYTQTVYLSSEINASGTITGIQYFFSGTSSLANSQNIVVYMAESTRTNFSTTGDWEPISSFTQVYSGGITVSGTGWVTLTLDTPFAYSGVNNLIIAVDENASGFDSSGDDFHNTQVSSNRSISYFSDSTNPDPASPPTASNIDDTIANIIFDGITQACPSPTALVVDNLTSTEVTLSWTAGGSETDWEIAIQPDGTAEPTGAGTAVSTNPYTDSSLTDNTAYEVWLRADCGSGDFSAWIGPVDFTTPVVNDDCAGALDYASVFGAIGANGSCPGNEQSLDITNFTDAGEDPTCETGFDAVAWYTWTASTTSVDFTSGTGSPGLEILDGSCGSFTSLGCLNNTSGRISGLTIGTLYYILIYDEGTFGSSLEWCLEESPSCFEVSNISIDSFTDTEVTVSWTPSGSGETDWEIILQEPSAADPGSGDSGTAINAITDTAPPYTFSGLNEQTTYEVWIRANCGAGDLGEWINGSSTFTTTCSAIIPDYIADMSIHIPDACWDEAGSGDPATGPSGIGFSDWRGNRSYSSIPSNAINLFDDDDREWLISPEFDLSSGGPYQLEINTAVTVWTTSGNSTADATMGSDDEVQLLISTDGGATWSNLITWNAGNEPLPTGTEYIEDLSIYNGTVQFAVWASDGTTNDPEDYDFHVGTFRVVEIPANVTVDFCNIESPASGLITEGDTFDVTARIFQDGRTQPVGSDAGIEAWIGYSTVNASSVSDFGTANWTWIPSTFDAQFGNDDQYISEIGSTLSPGDYFYVSRFRVDGGIFAYGGIDISDGVGGNFWDGTAFVSGELTVLPTPPTTAATLTINGCNATDSFSGPYDTNVEGVVWVELIFDGNCSELTVDTATSGFDTEIGLYDSAGNLIGSNDDDTGGISPESLFTGNGLAAGTYYIAAARFNVNFSNDFTVSAPSNAQTGTIVINASTPNVPDFVNLEFPGSATIIAGNSEDVFAQIFETGVTQGAGAGAGITAEIGISAVDATTLADFESSDWTWTTANYFGESGNNDEYSLAIGASLDPGTYYYVSRFSIDGGPFVYGGFSGINPGPSGGSFWDGGAHVSGVLTVNPKPEPTNHVLDFTASADSDTAITLTWSDNDGVQAADGFLIVGRTGATTFYAPIDGTDDADDTNWSDDEFEVKVASGIETFLVTGLAADTTYDFEIYPYTNTGTNIDYKTDGTIPSANATTDSDPCINILPDYTEDFSSYIPTCWQEASGGDLSAGPSSFGSSRWAAEEFAHASSSGLGAANVNLFSSNNVDWLLSPTFDLSAGGYQVAIDVALTDFNSTSANDGFEADDEVRLVYSLDGTNWVTIQLWNQANTPSATGETVVSDISVVTQTNVQFALFAAENADLSGFGIDVDFHIDNFVVESIPTPITYTFNGTWSPEDPSGVATSSDDIVIASGDATISANTSSNTVTVNPGAGLTVSMGVTLTVNELINGLTLESTSTSYSSLILDGTISGTINYQRHVNSNGTGSTGDNDLISAPLTGQSFEAFANANTNIFNNGAPEPTTLYLFGPFDKTTGAYVTYADDETATLDPGVGYRAASSNNSTFTFTGTANSGTVLRGIENSGPQFQEWNLIGNPYPSYLHVEDFLNNTVNQGLLDETNVGIYGYDGDFSSGWTILNLANTNGSEIMAPGQGFFVAAESAGNIEFTNNMRRTGNADDFIANRTSILTYVKLELSNNSSNFNTDFYFNDASSLGLDPGYDAGLWGGSAPAFSIFSELVEDNTDVPIAIQSLNTTDLSDVTIPIGVIANMGVQITFSILESSLPNTVDIYLDDMVANSSTLLSAADYTMVPNTDLSGTGRFFLRFAERALSIGDNALNTLSIYVTSEERQIVIQGQLALDTRASVYDQQGRLVAEQDLEATTVLNTIDGSRLSNGVYIVTLDNGEEQHTQKVILR